MSGRSTGSKSASVARSRRIATRTRWIASTSPSRASGSSRSNAPSQTASTCDAATRTSSSGERTGDAMLRSLSGRREAGAPGPAARG